MLHNQVTSRAFPKAEVVHMGKNLKARGPPEQWLAAVDKRLAEQLRRKTKDVVGVLTELLSRDLRAGSHEEQREIDSTPIQVPNCYSMVAIRAFCVHTFDTDFALL